MTAKAAPEVPSPEPGRVLRMVDLAAVAVLTIFTLVAITVLDDTAAGRPVDAMAYGLVVAAGIATAVRRSWPGTMLVIAAATTAAYLALGYPYGPNFGFVVITAYTAARWIPLRHSLPLGVLTFVMLLPHLATNDAALDGAWGVGPTLAWVAIPFTVGAARRLVVAASVRERAAVAARAADAERLRVSQEVHDVVGHGLAAIQMQAAIALHLRDTQPQPAYEALETIHRASSHALQELAQTLSTVHPHGETASTAPTPGLGQAAALCDRIAESGIEVELAVTGSVMALPTASDVAAYRILQESLTNVVKHSPHPAALVEIDHGPEEVRLTVTNQCLADHPAQPGIGITGMLRRIAAVGGSLDAGPGSEPGTFAVRARLPRTVSGQATADLEPSREDPTSQS